MNDKSAFDIGYAKSAKMEDKGFFIRFKNGYEVSVQLGSYNYSDNGQTTAEVAVTDPNGDFVPLVGRFAWQKDDVLGYATPEQVAELIFEYSMIKKEETV